MASKEKGRRLSLRRSAEYKRTPSNSCDSALVCESSEDRTSATATATSPSSALHNLTVTYHYVQSESPITASTRSLTELSSALPSDGAPLRSQHPLTTSPPSAPLSSRHKHTPNSSTLCNGRVRKRLKIDLDVQKSTEVQRLLTVASQLCSTRQSSSPEPVDSGNLLAHHTDQSPTRCTMDQETMSSLCVDEEEAFWSQAAEVLEGEDWEEDEAKGADGDSAFIDELLLSGLIRTPFQSTPEARVKLSTPPHSTPQQVVQSSSSSSLTTPLSHRSHLSAHKIKPSPLF